MKAYFDACVLVDLGLGGPRAAGLLAWAMRAAPLDPIFTDFGRGEVASALAQRVRQATMTAAQARSSLALIDDGLSSWRREVILPGDIAAATELLFDFDSGLRLPDAIHLAAAQRLAATLVTLDKKLFAAAIRLGRDAVDPLNR